MTFIKNYHIGMHKNISEDVIRAIYTEKTIRVYQAYKPEIAIPALAAGTLVPPFKMTRMTWIKPSFNWMMYRSYFATNPGQEIVLGIDITREGFSWALNNSVLSEFCQSIHSSREKWKNLLANKPGRIQWDPERDWRIQPIPGLRTIQIGLSGEAVERYVNEWIVNIEDLSPLARMIYASVKNCDPPPALPSASERPYPLDTITAQTISAR